MTRNVHGPTVEGFGREWAAYDQSELTEPELDEIFSQYFEIFPWELLRPRAHGMDIGCGSGRWAQKVAPRVEELYCIDASAEALAVAKRNLAGLPNCKLYQASVDSLPIEDASMDFGYCLGVLHHVPDTSAGLRSCVSKLKAGAPFLVYLYYAFDNRPKWYRALWRTSDSIRRVISRLPYRAKLVITTSIALLVYLPFARTARFMARLGRDVGKFPLSYYRDRSFYTMRTDALDRFGTRLEKRFTATEISDLMTQAGLERVAISPNPPYWCAIGFRS